ncbi:hypothetical protein AGABI2DRAFT_192673 [Agaricus bisporus var. bisporus H97]|uniref:hypothetical protein n=1 Tax=Agaricus bisporus var. bisporus (strain H97 / ATCC MYA-4626 / FGSC 10389) TaxID=936046 RepID=UPI00029F6FB2|nr:hypothetical protein AGABI2DRAFT_192673 [Agaricus bisporus var. bisporus H97]EKV47486.1 hypothetical protein AGABI2DRAFT_192673 [Agaricus bisporus var. bisporus H97]
MQLGFVDTLVVFLSLGISLLIVVPLTGVLVRFRANYNPKALQLDAEGGAAPHTGPVVNSYFSMMARVWRIEGIAGLYKGLMPTTISTVFVTIVILIFLDTPKPRHGAYKAPDTRFLATFAYSVGMMLISLPTAVLTYRSITTPHRLGYFNLMKSLRVLLTSTERQKPWIIYFTPGLLAAETLHIALVTCILNPLRRVLLPTITPQLDITEISLWKAAVYFVIVACATIALAPLEVIATRLAIQRNHASTDYDAVAQEPESEGDGIPEYSGTDEDVIGLRHEGDPYTGLVDCAKNIVNEEGVMALYRAWWVTLLGGLGSAFV